MLSCSKGSRGLFVPSRVIGIFTDTTISLSSWLRQRPDHYTIRAGRNLPDKEFLPQGFVVSRRLPIFTRRFQRTILGTSELNFCVRNGNRWNLTVIVTDQYDWFSITFLSYFVQYFLKDVPSKLNNHC